MVNKTRIYEKRVQGNIALPEEAWNKANELRGEMPMMQFLGRIVCEKLGVGGIKNA
jgi:hypothetical protein